LVPSVTLRNNGERAFDKFDCDESLGVIGVIVLIAG